MNINIILKQLPVGFMDNFSYLIGDKKAHEVAVVDPAWDVSGILKEAEKDKCKIAAVLLTHGHFDHTDGVEELLATHDIPVYISKYERSFSISKSENLKQTENGEKIKIGNIEIECLHTPGHTPGCQCYKYEDILITGDTLFIDGCGRCDLGGSDPEAMYNTLYNIIMKLPDSTVVYPGHDYGATPFASLASQKKTNSYLTCKSKEEFLRKRMGF